MIYYSESFFRSYKSRFSFNEWNQFSSRAKNAPEDQVFDVFLSYNIADLEVVKGIYLFLEKQNLKVYFDHVVDPDLKRASTDKSTAARIQNRLKHSRSLIYAQSQNANQSNWMPWELGVVDGKTGKCMIMPVTKDDTKINPQREYLLLYPYVKPNCNNDIRVYVRKDQREDELIVRTYING